MSEKTEITFSCRQDIQKINIASKQDIDRV